MPDNYTSQRGEEEILQDIFAKIGVENQWCVEFGACDGKHNSNSWYWINKRGWRSVQIEGARDWHLGLGTSGRDSFDGLLTRYGKNKRVVCLNRWAEARGTNSLDAILAKTPLPRQFDFLSIDVDGNDYAIWEALADFEPRVVIIEHNKTIPIEVSFHSDRGSSLRALTELGKHKGYELAAANDLNGIFVRNELFPKLRIADNSPAALWRGHEQFRMWLEEKSDGALRLVGPNKLRWVRGADGTVSGQLAAGHFTALESGQTSLPAAGKWRPSVHGSGLVRHLLYSLGSRV